MNTYEERKQQRIERYQELAEKHKRESEQRFKTFHQQLEVTNGQPILIGHHSERSHRALLGRMDNNLHKGVEAEKTAEYYNRRAASAASSTAISSDDPEAVTKLKDKIYRAEQNQALMVAANKIIKRNTGTIEEKTIELQKLGIPGAVRLFVPDFCGRVGYPGFELTNNRANIRRMKERLAHLEKHSNDTTTETTTGDIQIIDNVELNRLQIIFPDKPSEEIRTLLKSRGFRWSPTEGAWQRQRSNAATWGAQEVIKKAQEGK